MDSPAGGLDARALQARALRWLAQREHSRAELRGKLLRAATAARKPMKPMSERDAGARIDGAPGRAAAAAADDTGASGDTDVRQALQAQIDRVLDLLQAKGLLSDERFVESRLRVRAAGVGTRRLEAELARHQVELQPAQRQQLHDSELQRAVDLWVRRFGAVVDDPRALARPMRFLAGRGFAHDVIRRAAAELRRRARDTGA